MKVVKPQSLGLLPKPFVAARGGMLAVAVTGFFDMLAPDLFLRDAEMWSFVKGELPPGTPLDMGMPKVRPEFLVFGSAMAPGGKPVSALPVEVSLGRQRRQAVVWGDRAWRMTAGGLRATEPKPFTEMRLDWANAFGGLGFARNPLGKGFDAVARTARAELVELPNIEAPGQPVTSAADRFEPHGFGPIDIAWPQRTAKAGTFDDNWVRRIRPAPPPDQDPTIYNSADPAQWADSWFAGDEAYTVQGMHPTHTVFKGRLPAIRPRCFLQVLRGGTLQLRELALHAETVLLFPSKLRGIMLYRGLLPTERQDARDVKVAMIGYERQRDEPRSHDHYAEVFRLRTEDEAKAMHSMNDLQLSPAVPPETEEALAAEQAAYTDAQLVKEQSRMDRRFGGLSGRIPEIKRPKVTAGPLPRINPAALKRGDFDVASWVTSAVQLAEGLVAEAQTQHDAAMVKVAERRASLPRYSEANPPAVLSEMKAKADAVVARAAASPDPAVRQAVSAARAIAPAAPPPLKTQADAVAFLRKIADKSPANVRGHILQEIESLAGGGKPAPEPDLAGPLRRVADKLAEKAKGLSSATLDGAVAALRDGIARLASAAPPRTLPLAVLDGAAPKRTREDAMALAEKGNRAARLASPVAVGAGERPSDDVLRQRRAEIVDAAARREPIAGRDLAHLDLSGIDFRGLDCTEALFDRARLDGADFSGANLTKAVFTEASLRTTKFDGATLTEANFGAVEAAGVSLRDAHLHRTQFFGAKLEGADFSSATLSQLIFMSNPFAGARFRGARLDRTSFVSVNLDGADFTDAVVNLGSFTKCTMLGFIGRGATLFRSAMTECEADRADLSEAKLTRFSVTQTRMRAAVLHRAWAKQGNWFQSDLTGADFALADLDRAFIGECRAQRTSFFRASMRQAILLGSDFTDANFGEANLFRAALRNAVLQRAEFCHASLYGAITDGADLSHCDFTAANLRQTVFSYG